ncbi:MAG: IS3 family transposase [Sphaerochaetaceae bacterium]|jgi:putative transposase|nr:IS3 family transposase [Sphaerochaetaceae bacterium]
MLLSRDYDVKDLCLLLGVSRAGFYKWKKQDKSKRRIYGEMMIGVIEQVHKEHPSHGYRWVAAFIRINIASCSESYAYKVFRFLGIKSESKHQVHCRPRKVRDKYPNLIFSTWETVDRPLQVIVSDMTAFHVSWLYIEVTFYFDVFTKQILAWRMADKHGAREQYTEGLEDVASLLKGCKEPTILHTDQGSVYTSMAYNEIIKDTIIVRSMSRAGKPTDNPVNEALNGWIKEELYMDFHLDGCRSRVEIGSVLTRYVSFYNRQRPCWALSYDTPDSYYRRFMAGELAHEDTFSRRKLDATPKFARKRILEAERGNAITNIP